MIEEQALYDQFDFSVPLGLQPTDQPPPYSRTISSLICPSDGPGSQVFYDGSGMILSHKFQVKIHGMAKGNYAAFMSPIHMNHFEARPGALGGFEMGSPEGMKLKRVVDGTSKTLAVTEVRTLDREWDSRGVWAAPFPGASTVCVNFHDRDSSLSTPHYEPDPNYVDSVRLPNMNNPLADQIMACTDEAYAISQGMACRRRESVYGIPRSRHPGGVHASTLDGRVGFLTDSVDPYIYAYLVSVNDRRAIDPNDGLQ